MLKKNWQLYLLFLPPLVWFILFRYWPMVGVQIAFKDFRPGDTIFNAKWIGLANFTKFFRHYLFWDLMKNTIVITLYQLAVNFPLPIIFALALNATCRDKFRKVVQYITYMPYFISTVVMVGIIMQLLNSRIGVINNIIAFLGGARTDFMASAKLFSSVYVWSGVWQNTGWNSIIYLAALSSISQELHEAAMIDGASRLNRVIHIDLPGIAPTMIVLLIMNCGQIMNLGFEKIFLMQNSMNLRASQVISTYVYSIGLKNAPPEFSYGTAIDLFNSAINLLLIVSVNKLMRRFGESSLW
ncbi:MAG: ABC transporter permease subunit [Clostridiales bacterium]|nr:ABC transporter permease subunit [Clostridiales bacterium]